MTLKVRKAVENDTIEEDVFWILRPEIMPSFPGGEAEMFKFLKSEVSYPDSARHFGITGTVYISFIIERDGSFSEVSIYRGVHAFLNEEAIRIVKKMPKWIPGFHRGENVRVRMILPIKFLLK